MEEKRTAGGLGGLLNDQAAPGALRLWRKAFFGILAAIAALSLIIKNRHPHFGFDAWPLFWPLFGLVLGLALVFLAKKAIQPVIKRGEDHYGDL
jgi:hypothetical protein